MNSDEYRALRLGMGLTQNELARRLGVDPMTVSRRERGGVIDSEAELAIRAVADADAGPHAAVA